jgi:hypothetical protein
MFNSPIIDVAITLSFTYFMLSLIISAFNEFVYSLLSKRGKMLKQAICDLLFDDDGKWKAFVTKKIYTSPQIQCLQKSPGKFPSYIPAANFATAVIDTMRTDGKLLDMNTIRDYLTNTTADNVLPLQLRLALLPMFERAQGDVQKLQAQIETFYNNAMDRVTGWYKRQTSKVIFFIALTICVLGNIDTINMVRKLWGDPQLAAKTDKIIGVAQKIKYDKNANSFSMDSVIDGVSGTYEITQTDTATRSQKKITVSINNAAGGAKVLVNSGVPIGWPGNNSMSGKDTAAAIGAFFVMLAGWLITAFAVMLGAPFWFDLMNKFINLRGSGKKPDEKQKANAANANSSQANAVG